MNTVYLVHKLSIQVYIQQVYSFSLHIHNCKPCNLYIDRTVFSSGRFELAQVSSEKFENCFRERRRLVFIAYVSLFTVYIVWTGTWNSFFQKEEQFFKDFMFEITLKAAVIGYLHEVVKNVWNCSIPRECNLSVVCTKMLRKLK